MKQGFVIPGGSATEQRELAVAAEAAGWDGVFVSELAYGVDPWVLLSAVGSATSTIRLGTMLTPLPWRRPWKLAGQVATLDQLTGGRAVLMVGLGAPDPALGDFGEVTDRRTRAELLDEGIDVLDAVWSGRRTFTGTHHRIDLTSAVIDLIEPAQRPRVPVWCVGAWPAGPSLRRVMRCDGLLPATVTEEGARQSTPEELAEMLRWLEQEGKDFAGFDVVVEGQTEPGDPSPLDPWRDAGATWWVESLWGSDPAAVRERLAAGPAR